MLLVSDSENHSALFRQALAESGLRLHLNEVRSSTEAISMLKHEPPFASEQLYTEPDVIVVDLVHGDPNELLLWIQTRPEYKSIHTVVISAHPDPATVTTAYSLAANAVLARPADPEELRALYRSLCRVWSLSEPVSPKGSA